MPILTDMGRSLLQFGIALFILSHFYVFLMAGYGFPVHPLMEKATYILPAVDLVGIISSGLYVFGRYFVPQIAQAFAYGVYLTLFVGSAYALTSFIAMLFSILPLPGLISGGMTAIVTSIALSSMIYYLATRVSGMPPE